MAIPDFDEFGFLPEGIHECTLDEALIRLCPENNACRAGLGQNLKRFLSELASVGFPLSVIYLNGKFAGNMPETQDIDLLIREAETDRFSDLFDYLEDERQNILDVSKIDVNLLFDSESLGYWHGLKIKDKVDRGLPPVYRKGILRVCL